MPLTSKTNSLLVGEFVLADWRAAGLNVESAVKRGLYTVRQTLVAKSIVRLTASDTDELGRSLRGWLGLILLWAKFQYITGVEFYLPPPSLILLLSSDR